MASPSLDRCGCCAGLRSETPLLVFNRPGLRAIGYRVGTHAAFKASMLAALSAADLPALRNLRTRDDDDFAIALLDAWAVVADIVSFYQERIANEDFLRTATERMSLQELARLIGYELRSGVAASTYLAFSLEAPPAVPPLPALPGVLVPTQQPSAPPSTTTPAPPTHTSIPRGTRVQSVPGPGEQPQIFETIDDIEARVSWNAMKPRLTAAQPISISMGRVTLAGLTTAVQPGDRLLIVANAQATSSAVARVVRVTPDSDTATTALELASGTPLTPAPASLTAGKAPAVPTPLNDTSVAALVLSSTWRQEDLVAFAATHKWPLETFSETIMRLVAARVASAAPAVYALRVKAALFGHNAPRWDQLPPNLRFDQWIEVRDKDGKPLSPLKVAPPFPTNWDDTAKPATAASDAGTTSFVYLDAVYPVIVKDDWLVLEGDQSPPTVSVYRVKESAETTRTGYALTAKVTRLDLGASTNFEKFPLRRTTLRAQSERLVLADIPVTDSVQPGSILLDGAYLEIATGQTVVVSGHRSDLQGATASEVMTLASVTLEGGFTRLKFEGKLAYPYVPSSVRVNANIAPATHGETKQEIVGSGDASQPYQRFRLRQPPLTYTSAPTATGAESTLEVRVNDILWHEVPTLLGRGSNERVYVTSGLADGGTSVGFGDGENGARVPTGQENVTATYRKGIGAAGLLAAGQLSLLMTRPLGVKDVTNPLPTDGGEDPEGVDAARSNASLPILTLGRIVSLRDYEDFARAFGGIAKALATWTWNGQARGVFVTIAGPGGRDVPSVSDVYKNLLRAMQEAGDPSVPLRVDSYRPAFFRVEGTVKVDADYRPDLVLTDIKTRLRATYAFDVRGFGQPVYLSEVITCIQAAPGVTAVNVTALSRTGATPAATPPAVLTAEAPRAGAATDSVLAAELLTLDPGPLAGLVVTQ